MNHFLMDAMVLALAVAGLLWIDLRFESLAERRDAAAEAEGARKERERIATVLTEDENFFVVRQHNGSRPVLLNRESLLKVLDPGE